MEAGELAFLRLSVLGGFGFGELGSLVRVDEDWDFLVT